MLFWGSFRSFVYAIIFSFLSLVSSNVFASNLPDITVGPEFEFSRPAMFHLGWTDVKSVLFEQDLNPGPTENEQVEKFRDEVIRKCAGRCLVEQVEGKYDVFGAFTYKVTFEDGFYFKIEPDVFVVEITAKPMKLSELQRHDVQSRYQEFIFETAKSIGLRTNGTDNPMSRAAGHFNFGLWSAFEDRGQDFLRYFVDRSNFPELSMGGFYKDYFNAPPMTVNQEEQRQALDSLIELVKRNPRMKPNEVAKLIIDRVYTETYFYGSKPYHFQSIGLKNAIKSTGPGELDRPMEHRDHKMQESIYEFVLLAEMIQLRLGFLKTQTEPIVYLRKAGIKPTPAEIATAFYIYVTEAGGEFKKFRSLLLPKVREVSPSDFVLGKVNWQDPEFQAEVRRLTPQMMNSPLLRERLLQAIQEAHLEDRPFVIEAVRTLESTITDESFKDEQKMRLIELLETIKTKSNFKDFIIPRGWSELLERFRVRYGQDPGSISSCSSVLM